MTTPFEILTQVVEETRGGQRSPDQLHEALDQFQLHLEPHVAQLDEMTPPDEYRELYQAAQAGYQLFASALEVLRDYADSQQGALADEGLELAAEGHELLLEVEAESAANFEALDADL